MKYPEMDTGSGIIKPLGNGVCGTVGKARQQHALTPPVRRGVSSSVDVEPSPRTMRRNGLSLSSNLSLSDLGEMFTPMVMLQFTLSCRKVQIQSTV